MLHWPYRRSAEWWSTPAVRSSPRPSRAGLAALLLPAWWLYVNSFAEILKNFKFNFFLNSHIRWVILPSPSSQWSSALSHGAGWYFSQNHFWLPSGSSPSQGTLPCEQQPEKKFQNSWYFWKSTANIPPGSAAQLPSWSSHRWVCPSSPQTLSSPCLNISCTQKDNTSHPLHWLCFSYKIFFRAVCYPYACYCNSPSCHQTCLCQLSPYHSCYIVPLGDQLSLDGLELCQLDLHLIIYVGCCVGQVKNIYKNCLKNICLQWLLVNGKRMVW